MIEITEKLYNRKRRRGANRKALPPWNTVRPAWIIIPPYRTD